MRICYMTNVKVFYWNPHCGRHRFEVSGTKRQLRGSWIMAIFSWFWKLKSIDSKVQLSTRARGIIAPYVHSSLIYQMLPHILYRNMYMIVWKNAQPKIESEEKTRHIQQLTSAWKKNHIFCPILMKFCETNQLLRWSFSQSFIRIGQKMWIFH